MKFYNLLKRLALSVSVPQSSACSPWLAAILAAKGARKDQALEVAEVLKTESVLEQNVVLIHVRHPPRRTGFVLHCCHQRCNAEVLYAERCIVSV